MSRPFPLFAAKEAGDGHSAGSGSIPHDANRHRTRAVFEYALSSRGEKGYRVSGRRETSPRNPRETRGHAARTASVSPHKSTPIIRRSSAADFPRLLTRNFCAFVAVGNPLDTFFPHHVGWGPATGAVSRAMPRNNQSGAENGRRKGRRSRRHFRPCFRLRHRSISPQTPLTLPHPCSSPSPRHSLVAHSSSTEPPRIRS